MDHHGVDRVSLLQLKQQLFHRLGGVVPTQVDHHLLYLKTNQQRLSETVIKRRIKGNARGLHLYARDIIVFYCVYCQGDWSGWEI